MCMKSLRQSLAKYMAIGAAIAPLAATTQPAVTDTGDSQGGRYRLAAISQGTSSVPYIIDTQTGRVWRQVLYADKKSPVFISMEYQNADGQLSKVPNEVATTVAPRAASLSQPQRRQEGEIKELLPGSAAASSKTDLAASESISPLQQLTNEVAAASKEIEYWRRSLNLCKQGKPFKMLTGFSPVTGEPMSGDELQPSDELKAALEEAIRKCVDVKGQKEQEIRRLTTSKPEK
jgi:hypothetical protein